MGDMTAPIDSNTKNQDLNPRASTDKILNLCLEEGMTSRSGTDRNRDVITEWNNDNQYQDKSGLTTVLSSFQEAPKKMPYQPSGLILEDFSSKFLKIN